MTSPRLPKNPRLETLLGYLEPGERLLDVGCDHAYLAITALLQGKFQRALATDIHAGPLAKAEHNRQRFGLAERLELHLTDGLSGITVGAADSLVIAGMGGREIAHILEGPARPFRQMLFQVNWTWRECRLALMDRYCLQDERVYLEGRHLYRLLFYRPYAAGEQRQSWSLTEAELGPYLLQRLRQETAPWTAAYIRESYRLCSAKRRSEPALAEPLALLRELAEEKGLQL